MTNTPFLMSSGHYPDTRNFTGLFDENIVLSPMADANKAYLAYCSSDSHVGN